MKKMKSKAITMILLACLLCQSVTGCGQNSSKNNTVENSQAAEATPTNDEEAVSENEDNISKEQTKDAIVFFGKDIEGNAVDSAAVFSESKLTMVNVWATFCQPCIQELPDLEALNNEWKGQGIQVVGILSDVTYGDGVYDQTNWDLGKNIIKEKGVTYKNIMCDVMSFQDKINIDAVPTTFFVDQNGKMVGKVQIGSVSKEEYKALAEEALAQIE